MYSSRRLMPILNALLAFEEAARHNSFTRAGKRLGMAQPSVSRFVSILENHLGATLFERRHNRLRLTSDGERLYQSTATGLDEIRLACGEIEAGTSENLLTVECTYGFAHMWLLPRIQSLLALLAGWKLRTISSDDGAPIENSDADLVVCLGDGDWESERNLLLFNEQIFPVCSPAFARAQGLNRRVGAEALMQLPLVIQDFGDKGWFGWKQWFAHFGLDYRYPDDAHPVNHYPLSLQAAMEGRGIAMAWAQLDSPFLENNWLFEIPGLRLQTGSGYYLVFRRHKALAQTFANWVEQLDANQAT